MKILFYARALTIGGSERQLALTASGLAQRGHDVSITVLYEGEALEPMARDHGVRLLPIGKTGRWHLLGPLARLWRLFLTERPDVVYAFLPAQTATAALVLPPWLSTRLVFGLRAGAMRLEHYDRLAAFSYRLEALLSRRAALLIANAQSVRVDAIGRGLPADRICVIPNGIDTDTAAPDRSAGSALRRAWGLDDNAFVIGMVARLDPMKDHDNFLSAAAQYAREDPDARFVCVGDGAASYRDKLNGLARSLGIAQRVVWAGEMRDVRAAYNAFDVSALSSAFGEGFPNVVGEALACGVPVAATDVGDTRHVIGDFGEVVPPGNPDALSAAWTRLKRRLAEEGPALRAGARSRIVTQFGTDAMVRRTEAALAAVCDDRIPREFPYHSGS
jgi:glycosyltransferase involved in cell wall biosynthesis